MAVLDPETLDWVDPAIAFVEHTNSVSIKNVKKYFINFHKLLSCNYFCLNQSAYHHKTIQKMKSSFHLEYKYIFCLLSRRSRQIIRRALEIIYSFCSFTCSFSSSSFTWQHVPDSSFSFECVLQHFFGSIDTLHTPHVRSSYNYKLHTYHRVLLKNNGNCSYNFYTYFLP